MSDGITLTVALRLKPEEADSFCSDWLPELLTQTLAFEGVRSVRAVRQENDRNRVMFIDEFDSVAASEAYIAWRTERGEFQKLLDLLADAPIIDIWPTVINPR